MRSVVSFRRNINSLISEISCLVYSNNLFDFLEQLNRIQSRFEQMLSQTRDTHLCKKILGEYESVLEGLHFKVKCGASSRKVEEV